VLPNRTAGSPLTDNRLSAEVRVALAALRVALDCDDPAVLRDVLAAPAEPLQAERFVAFCRYHGIVPSVHRALRRTDAPRARPLRRALSPLAEAAAGGSLLQVEALRKILGRFDAAGIEVLPIKGLSLDVRVYGGPGRRKHGDHDLLVPPDRLDDAVRVLRDLGYRSTEPERADPAQWLDTLAHGPPMVRTADDGPRTVVELHWALAERRPGFPMTDPGGFTERLWDRSRPGELLGHPVRVLTPENEVVYLSLHLVRHLALHGRSLYVRLAMLEDLYRVARAADPLDPATVRERVRALGPIHVLGPVQYLSRRVLGATPIEAPEPWPTAIWEPVLSLPVLLSDPARVPLSAGRPDYALRLRRILTHALLLCRWSDRWALLRRFATRTNEHDRGLTGGVDGLRVPARLLRLGRQVLRDRWG
jgi:hypothetical protein